MAVVDAVGKLSVNERLLDASVHHALLLERLKSSEVNRIITLLNRDVIPDMLDQLMRKLERINLRGFESGVASTQKYRDLIDALREIVEPGFKAVAQSHADGLVEVAASEAEWQRRAVIRSVPIEFQFELPNVSTLRSIVTSRPFQGAVLRDWWSEQAKATQAGIRKQINIGLAEGEDVDAMVRRIRGTAAAKYTDGVLQTTRRNAESIVRTATSHVTAHAREATFEENADLLNGVQWVSTLDTRTTPTCRKLDGKVFKTGEGPRPPAHWGCRSTTTPVLKSASQLGLGKFFRDLPEGTRASMDGQVPASLTYYDWLARQPAARQDMVLGPERGRLLRAGKITTDDLKRLQANGQPITLKQLAALDAA